LLPPPNPIGSGDGRVPALSELLEQVVEDASAVEIDSDVAGAPELQDTLMPDSGIVDCGARLGAEPSLPSRISAVAVQERAELDIQDYSLQLDNPYAASSLLPPKRRSWRHGMRLVAAGAVAAAVAGLAGSTMRSGAPVAAPRSERASSIVQVAPVSPTPLRSQAPISAQSISSEPVTLNSTERAPAVRAEKRAATLAKPRSPSPSRRARMARKASPVRLHERASAPASGETPAAALPLTPTREQVVAGFTQVRGALAHCASGKSGVVEIQATIMSSGRISTAVIGGDFEGTPEGSCMARAARLASFARFSQPMLRVRFPMAL
jgi:hypothetical protein